ncbi:alpha/beta hydrolase family protein [Mycolicibacterium sp. ND9-15]|uniref:alpha/beta hydrolase n=1 Tax=Mycolicibacterium sp. ND9-15 TaxID=3042320 RepID=UPI002DDC5B32|nr:alpha/beta hydrolase family protein [Mycolicibacterium sp. ND9-15]WSE57237.1 alpha/beta hydrolase family protein [Mycolicibacterium sp. ND9-15]
MLKLKSGIVVAAITLMVSGLTLTAAPASAQPDTAPGGAHITGVEQVTDRWQKISVFSPSMDKIIVNDVFRAPDGVQAPIFYLLNGADGGVDDKGWFGLTNIPEFFGDKRVNVVSPIGGRSSFYTDWIADDPALGRNKWQTYLTQELPPLMDQELNSNGLNAIARLSMSGGSALDLAIQAPGLYKAAGSYSGCPATSQGKQYTQTVLTVLGGGGNATNMWGPEGSPEWRAHDPSLNAGKLNGVAVYVAASAGGVGAVDNLPPDFPTPAGGLLVEGITLDCSRQFRDAAQAASVPITYIERPEGAHTWGLFDSEMRESWNLVIGPALGV